MRKSCHSTRSSEENERRRGCDCLSSMPCDVNALMTTTRTPMHHRHQHVPTLTTMAAYMYAWWGLIPIQLARAGGRPGSCP